MPTPSDRTWTGFNPKRLQECGIQVERADFWVRDAVTNEVRLMIDAEWDAVMEPSPAPKLYNGHIDPDCEVYRGVGWMCTCETPEEKADRARERAEIEAERERSPTLVPADRDLAPLRALVETWRRFYIGVELTRYGDVYQKAMMQCADELEHALAALTREGTERNPK